MKKVAIFTEGQGELIFVRYLLTLTIRPDKLSFECFSLIADRLHRAPYRLSPPGAQIHFLLVNVGNDERALSAIAEREDNLVNKGYDKIIGLRDMYSEAYRKRSAVIDDSVTKSFIQEHESVIQQMSNSGKICVLGVSPKSCTTWSCVYCDPLEVF
jgi:hypothetical protein